MSELPATPHAIDALTEALRRLPGVGPKTAQRMAMHLLQHDRTGAELLGQSLLHAVNAIRHCQRCNTFTEEDICQVCASPSRDRSQLCVVESPSDLLAVEQSHAWRGLYFVLMGRISPLDGVGAADIGAARLLERAQEAGVEEVILATGFTAEGEVTAHALATALRARGLKVTRLARGVPAGSELEYVDLGTIAHALVDRR